VICSAAIRFPAFSNLRLYLERKFHNRFKTIVCGHPTVVSVCGSSYIVRLGNRGCGLVENSVHSYLTRWGTGL
jgi:hypothetical protein